MYTATYITEFLTELKQQVVSRPYIVRQLAERCLGWLYVFASQGQKCTPEWRKSRIPQCREQKYVDMIRNDCPVLSNDQSNCDGCQFEDTDCFDCAGFVYWLLKMAGVSFYGTGATTQWNTPSNWAAKGEIKTMPRDLVCCVYKWRTDRMSHTGMSMGDGNGGVIHCSGTVKRGNAFTDASPWTHWGIPAGLYTTDELRKAGLTVDESKNIPTLRRGSQGDEVAELQALLNAKYGANLDIDGDFGAKTEAAVKSFQKAHGLTIDGIVGPKTWAALGVSSPESNAPSNADTIWETLYNAIKNPYAVAGLMGNLYAESGLTPNNLQNTGNKSLGMTDAEYTAAVDSGTYTAKQFEDDSFGYGLAQWTYSTRKRALLEYAVSQGASVGDLTMQLSFLLDELRFSYSGVWYALLNAASVREASDAVLLKYERPKNQSEENQQRRAELGQKYFDQYAVNLNTSSDSSTDTNVLGNDADSFSDNLNTIGNDPDMNVGESQGGILVSLDDFRAIKAALATMTSVIKKYEGDLT